MACSASGSCELGVLLLSLLLCNHLKFFLSFLYIRYVQLKEAEEKEEEDDNDPLPSGGELKITFYTACPFSYFFL